MSSNDNNNNNNNLQKAGGSGVGGGGGDDKKEDTKPKQVSSKEGKARRASWSLEGSFATGRRLIKGSVSSEDLIKLLEEKLPPTAAEEHLPFNSTTFEMICNAISCADKLDEETLAKIETLIENSFEMPRSLVVTNLDLQIFVLGSKQRTAFEHSFREIDEEVKFYYFKSFRRCRVDFKLPQGATRARIMSDQIKIGNERINCYFAEIYESSSEKHLRPPALEKQFLISPPASPPEGWKPSEESHPVVNFDLQAALERLMPGGRHQLHPQSDTQPGIVVYICADDDDEEQAQSAENGEQPQIVVDGDKAAEEGQDADKPEGPVVIPFRPRIKIQQTACPPSMMNKDPNAPSTSRQ